VRECAVFYLRPIAIIELRLRPSRIIAGVMPVELLINDLAVELHW
jgi:hypothetical protein